MNKIILGVMVLVITQLNAQDMLEEKLPYYEIPEPSENYTAGTVAARMIDGLGFRYYWATEGLRAMDLSYKPSESGRTSSETIDHILSLSYFILNTISEEGEKQSELELSFKDKRKQTLYNFKMASDVLKNTTDISQYDTSRFPFWNIINGPISDALWHCGQVVVLRRASGNPFNSKVSVFSGKLRE
ncbi:hypothetical protein [Changchengzhania lutea]|uniref:hypothetical protein n=1 Tax=Changchengzhania lutea TaxID=2049305 RepID=UPI00115CA278|nr:hypothetical protein [Changchengzhania lutea]